MSSIRETAKLHGIDPAAYLLAAVRAANRLAAVRAANRYEAPLPWHYAAQH